MFLTWDATGWVLNLSGNRNFDCATILTMRFERIKFTIVWNHLRANFLISGRIRGQLQSGKKIYNHSCEDDWDTWCEIQRSCLNWVPTHVLVPIRELWELYSSSRRPPKMSLYKYATGISNVVSHFLSQKHMLVVLVKVNALFHPKLEPQITSLDLFFRIKNLRFKRAREKNSLEFNSFSETPCNRVSNPTPWTVFSHEHRNFFVFRRIISP